MCGVWRTEACSLPEVKGVLPPVHNMAPLPDTQSVLQRSTLRSSQCVSVCRRVREWSGFRCKLAFTP